MRAPKFDRARIPAELSRILGEMSVFANDHIEELYRLSGRRLLGKEYEAGEVWGTPADLKEIRENPVRWLRPVTQTCRRPPRFVVSYVGPATHEEVVGWVAELFDWVRVAEAPDRTRARYRCGVQPIPRDIHGIFVKAAIPAPSVRPGAGRKGVSIGYIVAETLASYLADSALARVKRQAFGRGLTYWLPGYVDVASDADGTTNAAHISISTHLRRRSYLPTFLSILFSELDLLRRGIVDATLFGHVIERKKMELILARARPEVHAERLFESAMRTGEARTFESLSGCYDRLRPEQFSRIVRKLLDRKILLTLYGNGVKGCKVSGLVRSMCIAPPIVRTASRKEKRIAA